MKRLYIWLRSFSLVQQFSALAFLVMATFLLFASTTLSSNINNFVNREMLNYLHRSQESYFAYGQDIIWNDGNVFNAFYDSVEEDFIGRSNNDMKTILARTDLSFEGNTLDGILDEYTRTVVYSIRRSDNGRYYLISVISDSYRRSFEGAFNDSVINLTFFVALVLFSAMTIWVLSLIRPLNYLKRYIDGFRQGEQNELVMNRGDEIGEVAEALQDMQAELQRQSTIREEMIQNISHDLKTPIATIKSYSESIKDGIYPYGTLEKSVDVIIEHADRLEKKVYSLITFNKMGYLSDTAPKGKQLPMIPVIRQALISVQVLRGDIQIEPDLKEGVCFHGDEDPWRIVVENLLDNAIRYAGSIVRITLRKDLLEVYNDGGQMSDERIEKLFKPYEKGTDGNFGLGLSIVKKVTETYGYNVTGGNTKDGVVFRIYPQKNRKKSQEQPHE